MTEYNLTNVKTKSGKTIQDFTIPEKLFEKDKELIELIMKSEAMNDGEKQYWFNLTKVMNPEQQEKLYGILRREKSRLAEIKGKSSPVDPIEAQKKAEEQARIRAERQAELAKKEKAQTKEINEDELLNAVDW